MNTVHLSGIVTFVNVTDYQKFVRVGVKIEGPGVTTWVNISGLERTHKAVTELPKLKGRRVLIEGQLTSYQPKEKDGKTPPLRYEVSSAAKNVLTVDREVPETYANCCLVSGKVSNAKANSAGVLFGQLTIRYYKPKQNDWGEWKVSFRCPPGQTLTVGQDVRVLGKLRENHGRVFVEADQILNA
jgi:hypothetical protein